MAIILNDNIDTRANKPTDNRFGPYASTSAALLAIESYQRYKGLTVGVGSTNIVEYWFKDGIADGDLILKASSGNLTGITAGNGIAVSGTLPSLTVAVDTAVVQTVSNLSTNVITDGASDIKYPSVKAVKTYVDGLTVGLLNDRGSYAPSATSPGPYPSTGGSGGGGAILKGDIWYIRSQGYLGTTLVPIGASVRALVDSPDPNTPADWDILDAGLGYIPENVANKVTDGSSITSDPNNPDKYPSVKALTEYLTTFTPSVPTLQQVVSSAIGANVVTGYTINVQNTSIGDLVTTIAYGEVVLEDNITGGLVLLGSSSKIRVQLGTDYTEYEYDRITFNKPSFTTTLLAKDSNQTMYLPAPASNNQVLAVSVNGNFADDSGNITFTSVPAVSAYRVPRMNTSATALEDSDIYNESSRVRIFANSDRGMPANSLQVGDSSGDMDFSTDFFAVESNLNFNIGVYSSGSGVVQASVSLGGSNSASTLNGFLQSAAVGYSPEEDDVFSVSHITRDITGSIVAGSTSMLTYADGRVEMYNVGNGNYTGNSKLAIGLSVTTLDPSVVLQTQGDVIFSGSAGIGTASTDASSVLEVSSTTKGFLPPRMTETQRDAITSPATGLMIYNTTTNKYNVRDNSGWKTLISGTGTNNSIPKFTSSNLEIGDSIIKELSGTQVQIGNGGGFMGFPYETLVLEKSGDIKFGVYTSANNPIVGGNGAAAYVLGATNFTVGGYYPGFEYQFVGSNTDADNRIRFNYLRRDSAGLVASTQPDLLNILADGRIGINNSAPQRALHINDVMRLEPRLTAPSSPGAGDIYYDSTVNKLRIYDGTSWRYVQFEP